MFDLLNTSMPIWTNQQANNTDNVKNTTNRKLQRDIKVQEEKSCSIIRMSGVENITWDSERCDLKSIFVCGIYKNISPIDFTVRNRGKVL